MLEVSYPFPQCTTCHLLKIGACTLSVDLKSCSNPEVNKPEMPIYKVIFNGYMTCGWYKELETRSNGECGSLVRCDYCDNCPYNPNKSIKVY